MASNLDDEFWDDDPDVVGLRRYRAWLEELLPGCRIGIAFEEKGSGGKVAALLAANPWMRTELQIKAEAAGARHEFLPELTREEAEALGLRSLLEEDLKTTA